MPRIMPKSRTDVLEFRGRQKREIPDSEVAIFTFASYGATVRAEMPDYAIAAALRQYLAAQVEVSEGSAGPPDVTLARCASGPRFWLKLGASSIVRCDDTATALSGLASAISYLIAMRTGMTFVHAGAVEARGAAVILPGQGSWGKSSLVAALVERGCGYLSDEYAVISPEGTVLPFSLPIRLRSDVSPRYPHQSRVCSNGSFPCAAVILTRFSEGSSWHPSRLSPGLTAMGVLRHAMAARDRREQALAAVTALARSATGYEGRRGEAGPTADAILFLLESQLADDNL